MSLVAAAAGCEGVPDSGPRVLELAHDTILLPDSVSLVDVTVRRTAEGDFDPAAVSAETGDVIRFTAEDNGSHAIVFNDAALPADALDYLRRTSQLRSPPLLTTGAAWVVTLDGAPPGEYPFRCVTHGQSGRLTVTAR